MQKKRKFVAFILTHGRADNVKTYATLRRQGYTGRICLVIDNEDDSLERYQEKFGEENIIVFDKQKYFDYSDTMDVGGSRAVVLPARNALFDIARDLGVTHFLELDDDYKSFQYRFPKDGKLKIVEFKNLDKVFDPMLDFLDESDALTVAFAQGGDFIGGVDCKAFYKGLLRKAMNTFFCRTDKPFKFLGRINEDANMYISLGMVGEKIFTFTGAQICQTQTQKSSGGLTEAYLDLGTYVKSFFSVMVCPSAVKVAAMGDSHKRIHHNVQWENCTPKILNQKWQKFV